MSAVGSLGKQFWKENPNQMALPGMEEHAHPGTPLLAKGYHFKAEKLDFSDEDTSADDPDSEAASLTAYRPGENPQEHEPVGELTWRSKETNTSGGSHFPRGEIAWVESREPKQGIASALYGMGRQMAAVKPEHSAYRTPEGDDWAPRVSAKYGGRVPKQK